MFLQAYCTVFVYFFFIKSGTGSLFRCKSSQIYPRGFCTWPVAMVLEVCANMRTYLQLDAHSATSSSLIIILFRCTLFQTCFCSGALKGKRWTFEHEKEVRRSFCVNQNPPWWETCQFFRRLTSGPLWTGWRVWAEWKDGGSSNCEGCWHAEWILNDPSSWEASLYI